MGAPARAECLTFTRAYVRASDANMLLLLLLLLLRVLVLCG